MVSRQVYEGLVTHDIGMSIKPQLATSWENTDPETWIFKIREGVTFHDGSALTAVKIYLAEFLSDTRVIEFPKFIWKIILHGIILRIRPKRSAKTYKTIWTNEGSPLLNIARYS